MIVTIKVKTRSSEQKVVRFGNNRFLIYLKSEPENNKANIEMINLLSRYVRNFRFLSTSKIRIHEDFLSFGIPVGRIKIKFGASSSDKTIELL